MFHMFHMFHIFHIFHIFHMRSTKSARIHIQLAAHAGQALAYIYSLQPTRTQALAHTYSLQPTRAKRSHTHTACSPRGPSVHIHIQLAAHAGQALTYTHSLQPTRAKRFRVKGAEREIRISSPCPLR